MHGYLYKEKNVFKIGLLCHLYGSFGVAHAHWKPNQHNQNFIILADFLHKVMSKCLFFKYLSTVKKYRRSISVTAVEFLALRK